MARTITEIHDELKSNFIDNSSLQSAYNMDTDLSFDEQFSSVSIESLFLYIVAVGIYTLEVLFDTHTSDVNTTVDEEKPHTLKWYSEKAKAFQYGDSLVEDEDYYETEDEDLQIITNAAVSETSGELFIKVAKTEDDELSALDDDELTAFQTYMGEIKDAGVKINYISQDGDDLKLEMDIWYDPLVIDSEGILLSDGETEPAKACIKDFIKNLDFDGEFILADLVDALRETEGVDIATVISAEYKYAANDYSNIDAKVTPEAGYLVISDDDLTLNYRANV